MATLAEQQAAQILEGALEIVTACKDLYFLDSEALAFANLIVQLRIFNKLNQIEKRLEAKQ